MDEIMMQIEKRRRPIHFAFDSSTRILCRSNQLSYKYNFCTGESATIYLLGLSIKLRIYCLTNPFLSVIDSMRDPSSVVVWIVDEPMS
jgi:hypothetical protein